MRTRRAALLSVLSLASLSLCASAARAQAGPASLDAAAPAGGAPPDSAEPAEPEDPWHGARRPWLYAADPTAPGHLHVIAALGVGYAQVDRGAARPFAADVAHAGAVFDAGAEVGLGRYVSIHAQGLLAGTAGTSDGDAGHASTSPVSAGAVAGISLFPLPRHRPFDLAVSGGYLRELGGANGFWGRVGAAGDIGPARLSLTALGEHVLEAGRDGVDILLTTGANVAVIPILRLGVEYVVQDLEGAWEPDEADGGIRHFVGPTAALALAGRVQLTAGPAFGLSEGSPSVLGRLAATYAF